MLIKVARRLPATYASSSLFNMLIDGMNWLAKAVDICVPCNHRKYKLSDAEVLGQYQDKGGGHSTANNHVSQVKGEGAFQPVKNTMDTEKDSWPHSPKGLFPASHDTHSNKEATSLAFDNTKISNHCFKRSNIDTIGTELCADDCIIGERCNEVDSNSYHYSLGDISQTDNLTFLANEQEDKKSNDLLYYGWPDIGNFEDVDRIFRYF
ncbi:hypothetical protein U1Q18_024488 [Sarracenia purpurea var. burkii]